MPNVIPALRGFLLIGAVVVAAPRALLAQQPDSGMARDSVTRADSVRADSIRRSELARIRAEPRAPVVMNAEPAPVGDAPPAPRSVLGGASVAADMVADLSPQAAARSTGSRIRMRDVEGAAAATYGERIRGVVAVTLTDDGSAQRLSVTDAALLVGLPASAAETRLVVGRAALPFGQIAQLHRHELLWPDQPLPIRVLLGADGLRGSGVQLRAARSMGGARMSLDVAVADRFGARIDSLRAGEPADQSITGVAAGGRVGASFGMISSRLDLGVSSISGKREQPIGCVYNSTVGPVPCPEGVNAANTRLTVLGADARAGWGDDGFVVSAEVMRLVVGATDLPVFSNNRFAAFYQGLRGTYDGGFVDANLAIRRGLRVGGRGEWLQNPLVEGLNDAWVGGYIGVAPYGVARMTLSYQRRLPSTAALAAMSTVERSARDRLVLRGTVVIGRHPLSGAR